MIIFPYYFGYKKNEKPNHRSTFRKERWKWLTSALDDLTSSSRHGYKFFERGIN